LEVKIREIELLTMTVNEKNEQSGELECTPECQTFQYHDSGNTGHRS
jgi:hypothetical protein